MPRAIVVGAGLAGLSAAAELQGAGWELEVLEARDRVGGRTWSRRLSNGAVIEMGAEFILPGNTEAAALAGELGLGLTDKGMSYGHREPRGGIGTDHAEIRAAVATLQDALAVLEDSRSADELLASLAIDDGPREAMRARLEISSAAAAEDVPASNLTGIAHIGRDESPSVAGGNQGLSLELAGRLGGAVELGEPVVAIAHSPTGVRVTTERRVVEGERCVIAVPASVIARIAFEPALPEAKREALAAVRYGHAAKLFVPLAAAVEPSAVMNVPERYWCWTANGADGRLAPVLSCFAGSPAALERLEVESGPQRWLESVAALRPELPLEAGAAVLSTWDDDPWVEAAYSISPAPQLTAVMCEPVGPLAFAGEHTAGEFNGLMEGAIRSGKRAADDLLKKTGRVSIE